MSWAAFVGGAAVGAGVVGGLGLLWALRNIRPWP